MKKILMLVAFCGAVAQAQTPNLDYGVASEVFRNAMTQQTSQNILNSTNLLANYRNYALEQELTQEAARRGLTERIDVIRSIEQARREILVRALRDDVIRSAKQPTAEAIEKEYKRLSAELIMPKTLRLDVYSIAATQTQLLEKAKTVLETQSGVSEQLTRRGFVHVTEQIEASWFTDKQVSPAIWTGLQAMRDGDVAAFPDGDSVLLIKRLEARDSRPMTLDEARGIVTSLIMRDSQNKIWEEYIAAKQRSLSL